MFSNRDLRNLIFPLFVEQFLLMPVGIADTFVVSFASEADVSGVSLANAFNTVLIFLFTALASGGAVIISQYTGSKNKPKAAEAAGQLLMISVVISAFLTALILLFSHQLLSLLFGKIEPAVMKASETYLIITTWSLPALAVYDAGAALCRSIGNCIGVFALEAEIFREKNEIRYHIGDIFCWDGNLLGKIMHIALPNGVESGIHHLVKVALSSMVALFGTYQIAANGLAQSIWSLASIMGLAMAPAYTTVIGQCMGAQDIESANFYFRKLNRHFRGSKIAGDLAGADKQYLQRAGTSVCRSAGKRPAGGR